MADFIDEHQDRDCMYVVYLDGHEWATVGTEAEAMAIVASYDGELNCWYEEEEDYLA